MSGWLHRLGFHRYGLLRRCDEHRLCYTRTCKRDGYVEHCAALEAPADWMVR